MWRHYIWQKNSENTLLKCSKNNTNQLSHCEDVRSQTKWSHFWATVYVYVGVPINKCVTSYFTAFWAFLSDFTVDSKSTSVVRLAITNLKQDAQLSQKGRSIVSVVETLKYSLGITRGHWKRHHSKAWIRFTVPISYNNYGRIFSRFDTIHERATHRTTARAGLCSLAGLPVSSVCVSENLQCLHPA